MTFFLFITAVAARAGEINENPASWRLQNYVFNDNVQIFFTSVAGCQYGGLTLFGTEAQKDRFWSLVLTAKTLQKNVGIHYTGCSIDDFYMDG